MWGCQGTCPEQTTRDQRGLENHSLTKVNTDLGEATLLQAVIGPSFLQSGLGEDKGRGQPPTFLFPWLLKGCEQLRARQEELKALQPPAPPGPRCSAHPASISKLPPRKQQLRKPSPSPSPRPYPCDCTLFQPGRGESLPFLGFPESKGREKQFFSLFT